MTETLYKEQAVQSCPDGWTCIECGKEFTKNTVDVKDYYVNYTDEGTICFECVNYQPTLECDICKSILLGDMPGIVKTCNDCIQEEVSDES